MKIAWIYPFRKELGNVFYGRAYARALAGHAEVEEVDIAACLARPRQCFERINRCDLAHVQYEVTFFQTRGRNGYERLRRRLRVPLVVTLHEVYRRFPDVYPRENVSGPGPVRLAKLLLYDLRHPSYTAYRRHLAGRFGAALIVVHYPYQKRVLIEAGVPEELIAVVGHPLVPAPPRESGEGTGEAIDTGGPLRLGSSGFINTHFDYDQLLTALERLRIPWHFTWIGGVRRPEDEALRTSLERRVRERGWGERFEITGWVSEEEMAARLRRLHLYLALFTDRSTSGTIMKAIAARAPIVARELPLTREINAEGTLMATVGPSAEELVGGIESLRADARERQRLAANIDRFIENNTYEAKAVELLRHYAEVLRR